MAMMGDFSRSKGMSGCNMESLTVDHYGYYIFKVPQNLEDILFIFQNRVTHCSRYKVTILGRTYPTRHIFFSPVFVACVCNLLGELVPSSLISVYFFYAFVNLFLY